MLPGMARATLESIPYGERAVLKSVLPCLEAEFYSDSKQTARGLLFNTRVRHHGETECEYAVAFKQLALYAYKDASQYHIESRCREQFLAGLRAREVRSHLGLFCSRDAKVHELVSSMFTGLRAKRRIC